MSELPDLVIGEPVPVGPDDVEWEGRARQMQVEALPRIRAIAEKWAGSITALLSVFGIASLVKGRDDVKDLQHDWFVASGITFAVAVGFAVAAIFLAALASQGGVRLLDLPTGRRMREWSSAQVETAAWQLALSRAFSLMALVFVVLGVGIIWYAPRDEEGPQSSVRVVLRDGDVLCGSITASGAGVVTLKPSEGPTRVLRLRDVSAVDTRACG